MLKIQVDLLNYFSTRIIVKFNWSFLDSCAFSINFRVRAFYFTRFMYVSMYVKFIFVDVQNRKGTGMHEHKSSWNYPASLPTEQIYYVHFRSFLCVACVLIPITSLMHFDYSFHNLCKCKLGLHCIDVIRLLESSYEKSYCIIVHRIIFAKGSKNFLSCTKLRCYFLRV